MIKMTMSMQGNGENSGALCGERRQINSTALLLRCLDRLSFELTVKVLAVFACRAVGGSSCLTLF